ncbi:hypothetical protein BHE90_011849 [Fusarium euwallaceae]|uniref:Xylanolytic transcriptional activator regulatory domain-containing protein n=1 Tax=Fusarium euwallaceae TaxID=1147111 RepID=A0A430LDA8_9HYPO|nr:hypothetical protein BHE90_011849 [Fusarium euwallaceae]
MVALQQASKTQRTRWPTGDGHHQCPSHAGEAALYRKLKQHRRKVTVEGVEDVVLPSEETSSRIIRFGDRWTSWLYFALDHPSFYEDHRLFQDRRRQLEFDQSADAAWLGIYFAYLTVRVFPSPTTPIGHTRHLATKTSAAEQATLLFMTTDEAECAGISEDAIPGLVANWFDSSIFFLFKSEFLRIPDLRNVQAIVLLGGSFIHLAEFTLFRSLWPCAFRISRSLGINTNQGHESESPQQSQERRLLFWSLVISDWLSFPLDTTCITDGEVAIELPTDSDEHFDESHLGGPSRSHHVQHQIAMCKISIAVRRFQNSLLQDRDLWQIITASDNELAEIISELPRYFQAGYNVSDEVSVVDKGLAAWQRRNITVVLLYYRMVINKVGQQYESVLSRTNLAQSSAAVCLNAAHGIVDVVIGLGSASSRQLIWSLLLPVFSAASTLYQTSEACHCGSDNNHRRHVELCIEYFRNLADKSLFAEFAAGVLQEMLTDG